MLLQLLLLLLLLLLGPAAYPNALIRLTSIRLLLLLVLLLLLLLQMLPSWLCFLLLLAIWLCLLLLLLYLLGLLLLPPLPVCHWVPHHSCRPQSSRWELPRRVQHQLNLHLAGKNFLAIHELLQNGWVAAHTNGTLQAASECLTNIVVKPELAARCKKLCKHKVKFIQRARRAAQGAGACAQVGRWQ